MPDILKSEYRNLEEAFAALPPEIREHSLRVSEYMKILFLEACAGDLYAGNGKTAAFMKAENRELAAAAGKYHDIGKHFVPEVYRSLNSGFSEEEVALYYRHAADSSRVTGGFLRDSREFTAAEIGVIEETIRHHHENWNGSGFPSGLSGEAVPVLARLLRVADALDNESVNLRAERPLERAIEMISERSGTEFAPEAVGLLPGVRGKLRRIFEADLSRTRAVPTAEQLIRRTASRPMALRYRPVADRKTDGAAAYEARLVFREKKEFAEYTKYAELLHREKLESELAVYMAAEACDALRRMDACSLPAAWIALELPGTCLNRRGFAKELTALIREMKQEPARICIMAGDRDLEARTKTMEENLKLLREAGVSTMAAGKLLSLLSREELENLKFSHGRVTQEMLENPEQTGPVEQLAALSAAGMKLIAEGMEKTRYQKPLNRAQVEFATGPACGGFLSEDELISRELALQN